MTKILKKKLFKVNTLVLVSSTPSVLLLLLHVGIVSGNKIVYFEYTYVFVQIGNISVVTWRLQTRRSHKFNYRKFFEKNWTHRLENARRNERQHTAPTQNTNYILCNTIQSAGRQIYIGLQKKKVRDIEGALPQRTLNSIISLSTTMSQNDYCLQNFVNTLEFNHNSCAQL